MKASIFIDPGVRESAVAIFHGPALVGVSLAPREHFADLDVRDVVELVIEKPFVYPGVQAADANDLLELMGAAHFVEGAIAANGGPRARYLYPAEWKGQIKKPVHHWKIWQTLSEAERERFASDAGTNVGFVTRKIDEAREHLAQTGKVARYSWKAHNLLDAVGLGLFVAGRTGRAGHRFSHETQV